ncbi:hypothetical protein Cob_v012168 [Colletotrichum orbiculare MAFF 240422]|uniref:F-box domain-containing protein n=1 Tax=Colletotrichum orbiculare (strain 104-T / ATCC 96160 / CBS 514.97 / LARS 414 / MAFF 240422) TaxID=1213857 RepID=A0A484FB97_COLOR|nr:hypothetical protein Cob_v012168 [Colletotrichum orbiculare MAFF 240422]
MAATPPADALAEHFLRLNKSDGSPDVVERRAHLDHLLQALSPWELLYLKQRLASKPPRLASMEDLPGELVIMVARYVDYDDAMSCCRVSQGWRKAWTSDLVVKHHLKTKFSNPLAFFPDGISDLWSFLIDIDSTQRRRANGNFISSLSVPIGWDAVRRDESFRMECADINYDQVQKRKAPAQSRSYAYCSGRVAWQPDAYSVFVDDLRTMERILVSPSDLVLKGEDNFVIRALTESLVVLAHKANRRSMIIYHLAKGELRRVTLPNYLEAIFAHKESIAVLCSNWALTAEPYLWTWSDGLRKIPLPDVSGLPDDNETTRHNLYGDQRCGVIFHPLKSEIIYFVALSPREDDVDDGLPVLDAGVGSVRAFKFENLKHTKTRRFERPGGLPRSGIVPQYRPMNSFGLYNLFMYYSEEYPDEYGVRAEPYTIQLNFNPLTEEFSYGWQTHAAHGCPRPRHASLFSESSYPKGSTRHEEFTGLGVDDDFVVAISKAGYVAWHYTRSDTGNPPWLPNNGRSSEWPRVDLDGDCAVEGCDGRGTSGQCISCRAVKAALNGSLSKASGKRGKSSYLDRRATSGSDYEDIDDDSDSDDVAPDWETDSAGSR